MTVMGKPEALEDAAKQGSYCQWQLIGKVCSAFTAGLDLH